MENLPDGPFNVVDRAVRGHSKANKLFVGHLDAYGALCDCDLVTIGAKMVDSDGGGKVDGDEDTYGKDGDQEGMQATGESTEGGKGMGSG